jgi:hypothetical protein
MRISLDGEGMSEGVTAKNCDRYAIVMGAPQQSQWGATVSGLNGKALKSGTYTLTITINGQTIKVPFEIGSASPSTPASISEATVQSPSHTEQSTTRPTESETPVPLVQTLTSFTAPEKTAVTGITWDGTYLWLSNREGTIFKVDTSGKLLDSFTLWDFGDKAASLAWDGSSFWANESLPPDVFQFQVEGSDIKKLSSFKLPFPGQNFLRTDLEWDGESLWYSDADQNNVYRTDTSGNILNRFPFSEQVTGLAWDGSYLWLAHGDSLSVIDTNGNELGSFPSLDFTIGSLAWGNGYLWTIGLEPSAQERKIYQLDVSLARETISTP